MVPVARSIPIDKVYKPLIHSWSSYNPILTAHYLNQCKHGRHKIIYFHDYQKEVIQGRLNREQLRQKPFICRSTCFCHLSLHGSYSRKKVRHFS